MKTTVSYIMSKDDVIIAIIDHLMDLGADIDGKISIVPTFKKEPSSGFGEFDGNDVFDGIKLMVKR